MNKHFSFKTFQEAFIEISKHIIEKPEFITDSRIGDVHEICGINYEVEDLSSYQFENQEIGRLTYDYASKFYTWMIGGCTDNEILLKDYPNVLKFMEKPKTEGLPENFNTFYGPRILSQLPLVVNELKTNPTTRRAVISILNASDLLILDKDETLEFLIRDGKLHLHLHMRSQNMAQVLKLDMYLWGRFACELSEELGLPIGTFRSSIVSAHVFKKDFDYINSLNP